MRYLRNVAYRGKKYNRLESLLIYTRVNSRKDDGKRKKKKEKKKKTGKKLNTAIKNRILPLDRSAGCARVLAYCPSVTQ